MHSHTQLSNSKILVTGTAGFIGYHLAKHLLERGDEVVGLDNINDYYDVNLKYARLKETGITKDEIAENKLVKSSKYSNYRFIKLNLEDRDNILDLFKKEKFDKVCNLAAQAGVRYSIENPYAYIESNIVGFINILEACRHNNLKHLVYASSSSVYGNNTKMPLSTSDNVDHPISLYAATKKSNELMAHTYSHLYGLPTTGLRFFTVYGPWGRPDMAYFKFVKAILEDKPIDVYNYGDMIRDFTYIGDIVDGVVRVIDNPPTKDEGIRHKAQGIRKQNNETDTHQLQTSNSKPETLNLKPETINQRSKAKPDRKRSGVPYGQPQALNLKPETLNPSSSPTAPYKLYNIGNSSPVQLLAFIKVIEKAIGKKAKMNMMDMQPGDVPKTHSYVADLINDLGYKPDTTIDYGVDSFVDWYKGYYKLF
ncbi:MAG: NAD-dependent epimerase [Bacteroidales bacterium]|nr:NAD-dependent epimerase [Bacteroidales bacterium]